MRLLLAEDEQSLSKALKAIWEGNHYSVDAVYDGVETLAYLDAGNYDALILDIMMPKLDGLSVLRRRLPGVGIRRAAGTAGKIPGGAVYLPLFFRGDDR